MAALHFSGIAKGAMDNPEADWRNFTPEHPLYAALQRIKADYLRDESLASEKCLAAYEKEGLEAACIAMVEARYDFKAEGLLVLIRNLSGAEAVVIELDHLLKNTLDVHASTFERIAGGLEIELSTLTNKARFGLMKRKAHWTTKAYEHVPRPVSAVVSPPPTATAEAPDSSEVRASDGGSALAQTTAKAHHRPRALPISGEKVKAVRMKLGMTQEKLAEVCNLSRDTIRRAEAGRGVSAKTLAQMNKRLTDRSRCTISLGDEI